MTKEEYRQYFKEVVMDMIGNCIDYMECYHERSQVTKFLEKCQSFTDMERDDFVECPHDFLCEVIQHNILCWFDSEDDN